MESTITWHDATTGNLPDSDILVLIHDNEEEVSMGFHDGEDWRYASGGRATDPVLHWADVPSPPSSDS